MTNKVILDRIGALYKAGEITKLAAYIEAGLITQVEADEITGGNA